MVRKNTKSKLGFKEIALRAFIVSIFILLFCVVLYLILKPTGIFEHEENYSVVFVVGARRNSRMINFDKNAVLREKIERVVKSYGFASIVVADGDPANQVHDYDFSGNKPSTLNKIRASQVIKDELKNNQVLLFEELKKVRAKSAEADIIEAINIAVRKLNTRPANETKEIIILGTGLSTAGFLNFTDENAWLYSEPSDILNILRDNKSLPELENISVIWMHITDIAEPQKKLDGLEQSNLREIWKLIIKDGGKAKDFKLSDETPEEGIYDDNSFPGEEKLPVVSQVLLKIQITSVTVTPQKLDLQKGNTFPFGAVVDGINNPSQDVVWSVSGNNNIATKIDENGRLNIADNETAEYLFVTATSAVDNRVIGNATVNIVIPSPPPPIVTDVVFNHENLVLDAGTDFTIGVTIVGINNPPQRAIWKLSGNSDPNTKIDNNGRLFIAPSEDSISLEIKATSEYDSSKFAVIIVKVYRIVDIPKTVDVEFEGNGTKLINEMQAKESIKEWVKFINEQDGGIYLFGCTAQRYEFDNLDEYNRCVILGEARANEVKRLFVEYYKINPNKIVVKGLGYNNPWHRDNGISGRYWNESVAITNRRVVIMSADDEYAKSVYNGTWRR